jgi:hypothetical protein
MTRDRDGNLDKDGVFITCLSDFMHQHEKGKLAYHRHQGKDNVQPYIFVVNVDTYHYHHGLVNSGNVFLMPSHGGGLKSSPSTVNLKESFL